MVTENKKTQFPPGLNTLKNHPKYHQKNTPDIPEKRQYMQKILDHTFQPKNYLIENNY